MGRAFSTYWGEENAYRVFVGKPKRTKPLERPRCRWEDHIKMCLRERG
jgi:hypothetical protein